ncbi:hypothetical protein BDP55DRAFT_661192 [Colletotrichum godetiae]|uniref:Xylanolytic transcriptional activator regulatory domain-containing protein n=1 Tax=Colletotrichum godetiae TaxID=1209918 RepID=A0AAJ0EWJ3_9PEZI|nr:uncharacterized protein BDP55DRAFT_661192 [Colletotrichum godetiae]KAK1676418.1 hypothetical protein BDP55DRAFT_661192 [Colletotrichum godetiae]
MISPRDSLRGEAVSKVSETSGNLQRDIVWRPSSFIDKGSIMYDPVKTPPTVVLNNLATGNTGTNDAILRVTGASILPQLVLLQALKDSFFEHAAFYYSVVDPGDVSGPSASVLLQQAVCLAGSLMRHGKDSVDLASSQYEKVKTLVHVGFEPDQLTVLKALCLMSCWSPSSPYLVTLDGPWHWTGMASRMALQLGLQKQSSYINRQGAGSLRRIFWHLQTSEILMTACWGRPLLLRPEDTDVPPLSEEDFAVHNFEATATTWMTRLIQIVGDITTLKFRKSGPTSAEVEAVVASLYDWLTNLPEDLRLFSPDGIKKPFTQQRAEIFIFYFVAIILIQTVTRSNSSSMWRTSPASVLAASCAARLYDEIRCRERVVHLIHYHAFLVLVVGVVLISHQPQSQEKESVLSRDLDVIHCILKGMSAKFGGARAILVKFKDAPRDFGGERVEESSSLRSETAGSHGLSTAKIVQDHMVDLFAFPSEMCENMDILSQINDTRDGSIFQDDAFGDLGRLGDDFDDITSFMDVLGMDFANFDGANC